MRTWSTGKHVRHPSCCLPFSFHIPIREAFEIISPRHIWFLPQKSKQSHVDKKYVSIAKKEHPDLFHFDSYSPHSMRHATGVSMVEAGVPLPVIRIFFGHESVATTEIYARITQPHLEEKIQEWNKTFWSQIISDNPAAGEEKNCDSSTKEEAIPDFLR